MSDIFRKELRASFALAYPVVLTQLGMMLMGVVDTWMVGDLGAIALGAVALGNGLVGSFIFAAAGILMALDAMCGQLFGARDHHRLGYILWQGYWISLALGIPFNLMFLDITWILELCGQNPGMASATGEYLFARSFSAVPIMIFATQRAFLSGIGNTRAILHAAIWANIANALADWVLIYGNWGAPELGLEGAGFATSICSTVMVLAGTWSIHRGHYDQEYGLGLVAPDRKVIGKILKLGVPFALHLSVEIGGFTVAAMLAGLLGDLALGAHQVAMTLASTTFMVPLGISVAASVRVAQAVGAREMEAADLAAKVAMFMAVGFMSLSSIGFLLVPELLAGLFVSKDELIDAAAGLIQIAAVFQVSDAIQVISGGCYRGVGDTKTPFIMNFLAHWLIGIPLGAWLAFQCGWGVEGLWWAITAALTVVGVSLWSLFLRGKWRNRKPLDP